MKSKRLVLAAAAFALTLTAIPVQPAAAGPVAAAKQKAVQAVEDVCFPTNIQIEACLGLLDRIMAALGL